MSPDTWSAPHLMRQQCLGLITAAWKAYAGASDHEGDHYWLRCLGWQEAPTSTPEEGDDAQP